MSERKPLLTLENLTVARGGLVVLEGATFEVSAGEALILRGPNGSGKTTLLRTLAGLQVPVSGNLEVDPEEVAYAAHKDAVKATLTVAENLAFWADLYGQPTISAALDAFGLTKLQNRAGQALSAGQTRRLGLARLLVTGRSLWLLDEPTVSLDKEAVIAFGEILKSHLSNGGAAVIATHIDLGLEAREIDLSAFKPKAVRTEAFDEAFL